MFTLLDYFHFNSDAGKGKIRIYNSNYNLPIYIINSAQMSILIFYSSIIYINYE